MQAPRARQRSASPMTYEFYFGDIWKARWLLLDGTLTTLRLSALCMVLSLAIAVPAAVARIAGPGWLRAVLYAYVEYVRNTPFLVQIFLVYFGLGMAGIRLNPNGAALIAMTANGAAYTIEIVRAGIVGVDRGQWEAGKVLGLSPAQLYANIVLPQALKIVYWPLASQFILIMLASSAVSVIATTELSSVTYDISTQTFRAFEAYLVTTGIYFGLSVAFSAVFTLIFWLAFARRGRPA
jgi:polar amino acid transport system permease protein